MSDAFKKYVSTIPAVFRPAHNRVISALITALANADDEIQTQIANAKDQLFVRTATGQDLDRLGSSLGVSRPAGLGMSDADYQALIPNLSLKPKQIKKAFYDTADVFWGPLFSRANLDALNFAPYNISPGDAFDFRVDGGALQEIKVLAGEVAVPGAATAEEIAAVLNRGRGVTAIVQKDFLTGDSYVNLRTETPGQAGSIEIVGGSGVGPSKVNFPVRVVDLLDLPQRVAVYNIKPNELLIEIPVVVPILRRFLKGSHHFHLDGSLEPPRPTANGIWLGSFLFNPNGAGGNFTVTSQTTVLQAPVFKGDVLTSLTVASTANIVAPTGLLMISFGQNNQEVPVRYRGVPNANTILIDPAYVFKQDHIAGATINVISAQAPYVPARNGDDYAVYLTSPSDARTTVQELLAKLNAAGIVLRFVVLAPKYRYILDNPYLEEDNAPQS